MSRASATPARSGRFRREAPSGPRADAPARQDDALARTIAQIEKAIDRAARDGLFTPHRIHPMTPDAVRLVGDVIFVLKFLGPNAAAIGFLRASVATVARGLLTQEGKCNDRTLSLAAAGSRSGRHRRLQK